MTNEEPSEDRPSSLALDLDFELFRKIVQANGWANNSEIAAGLLISERQLYRVLGRHARPGNSFIAGLLAVADGFDFKQLFVIVNESDPIGKG